MKECKKCLEPKELCEFYKHKDMGDGYLNICKKCTKKRIAGHRDKNIEKIKAYDRKRGGFPNRIEARRKYSLTEACRKSKNKASKKWSINNKLKRRCHSLVKVAIEAGRMERMPCSKCGDEKAVAHHEDYCKPLDVVWLCRKHHTKRHKELRELERI